MILFLFGNVYLTSASTQRKPLNEKLIPSTKRRWKLSNKVRRWKKETREKQTSKKLAVFQPKTPSPVDWLLSFLQSTIFIRYFVILFHFFFLFLSFPILDSSWFLIFSKKCIYRKTLTSTASIDNVEYYIYLQRILYIYSVALFSFSSSFTSGFAVAQAIQEAYKQSTSSRWPTVMYVVL